MRMKMKIFIYNCEITYGNYKLVIINNFDDNKDKFSYEKR